MDRKPYELALAAAESDFEMLSCEAPKTSEARVYRGRTLWWLTSLRLALRQTIVRIDKERAASKALR